MDELYRPDNGVPIETEEEYAALMLAYLLEALITHLEISLAFPVVEDLLTQGLYEENVDEYANKLRKTIFSGSSKVTH